MSYRTTPQTDELLRRTVLAAWQRTGDRPTVNLVLSAALRLAALHPTEFDRLLVDDPGTVTT